MGRWPCRNKGDYGRSICMALGVSSCFGMDIALLGRGFVVDVVESYPFYFDFQCWAVTSSVVSLNHLNLEDFLQVYADLPLHGHVEAPIPPYLILHTTRQDMRRSLQHIH